MGPDNRRILVATVASVAILILWQVLFPPAKPPPKPAQPAAQTQTQAQGAPGAAPVAPAAPALPAAPANAPEELVTLRGQGFEAVLSSHGGAVKSLVLEGHKFQHEDEKGVTRQVDLVHVTPAQPLLISVVPGPELGGSDDVAGSPLGRAPMRIVAKDDRSVSFEGRVGGIDVRKTFRLTGKPFELAVDLEVSGAAANGDAWVVFPGYTPPSAHKGGMFSGPPVGVVRPICRAGTKTERWDLSSDKAGEKLEGAVSWIGVDAGYFIVAALPAQPVGSCVFARGPDKGAGVAALRVPLEGGARKLSLTVYGGPKDLDVLRSYDRGFDSAIDYGTVAKAFAFFSRILLYVMRWFHRVVPPHNWGLAIILLTVLVKVLLFPLTAKSVRSMNEMRKLQPEIEKLKAKFGNDRDKLNQATMQLYQQHKVNPLGGCLPMLLQLPIWFSLYATLQTSVELYREPFLWMRDLTQHDPYFILPIAMGVSSFVMQRISPQPADSSQAKMMLYFMPVFFTVLMLFVPGGLTLYIFVNNVLSIAQQQYMMKKASPVAAT